MDPSMGISSVSGSVFAGVIVGAICRLALSRCSGAGTVTVSIGLNAVRYCGDRMLVGAQVEGPLEPMGCIWAPSDRPGSQALGVIRPVTLSSVVEVACARALNKKAARSRYRWNMGVSESVYK